MPQLLEKCIHSKPEKIDVVGQVCHERFSLGILQNNKYYLHVSISVLTMEYYIF